MKKNIGDCEPFELLSWDGLPMIFLGRAVASGTPEGRGWDIKPGFYLFISRDGRGRWQCDAFSHNYDGITEWEP